jgi:nucleoside 2-deoxyribosyltransferase
MQGKYKVITLCGSTRFKDQFFEVQKKLTLAGNIVISVGLFGHSGDDEVWIDRTKEMLDDMHKRKIDMADEVFVINVNGYIGDSTASEIKYAIETGKPVRFYSDITNKIHNKEGEMKIER